MGPDGWPGPPECAGSEPTPAGAGPVPAIGATGSRPLEDRAMREYKPSWEGGDKFSRKCDYGPIKRGGERLFRVVIAGLIPAIHGTAPEVQHTVQV